MREFSKELVEKENRRFEIGGEIFQWKYPTWDEYGKQMDENMNIAERQANGESQTYVEMFKDYIDRCEPYLEADNDALKRWRALSKRKVDPIPAFVYVEIFKYLVAVTANRPTELPSSFWNGQGQTEPSSTEGSS